MTGTGNILGYVPSRWDECIGNEKLVKAYKGLLKQVRVDGRRKAARLFVHGDSRTGKTATTKLFAQSMLCEQLDFKSLNPCGACSPCTADAALYGMRGLEVFLTKGKVHYLPIDATKITGVNDLRDLTELRAYEGTRIVVIDEVHRLHQRGMDEQLLKPLEERDFIWIVSSATPGNLEPMFLKRFTKLTTQLPDKLELAAWLARRCEEEGIQYEDEALLGLAERAECVTGVALQAIDLASLDPDTGLTLELVEDFKFEIET
jgi:DNA polymerase III gamma/tau subunit